MAQRENKQWNRLEAGTQTLTPAAVGEGLLNSVVATDDNAPVGCRLERKRLGFDDRPLGVLAILITRSRPACSEHAQSRLLDKDTALQGYKVTTLCTS